MTPLLKINLEQLLNSQTPFVIDLGCGQKPKKGRVTVDKVDMPNVDIVADIEEGLPFLPDNSVDELRCKSVLEHIDNFEYLMREIIRVLKPDGKAYIFVPHFSNPYYYSDYTHKRHFGLYSFDYFVETKKQLKRKVPEFYTNIRINIISRKLVFRSPFWFSRKLKKLFGFFMNLHTSVMEFYELHLCYICPCDGIKIVFTPVKNDK
ncbi:MAG: methyltransferase domain-containing protein [Sedimentisphaerales bacterium]|nr:methyltransferase domain-containing protein [Sedimentisphaerales bacterium]